MDWTQALEEERAALGRIVALLCALAGLAERAAGRSRAVRAMVLWLLRHAERTARDFICESGVPHPTIAVVPAGNSPVDAMRLAASLRALARQIDAQAKLIRAACRGDDSRTEPPPSVRMRAMSDALDTFPVLAALACGASGQAPLPDTS